ncbi:hypothetical protein CNECB9_4370029 [Cupriavidus necator]|uniref:Uncharacterized protein n=1 Tax=Cupriavidus necator TaxID=106590 RepID=A0A1K0JJN3_CUPNE|nr:hypothetical protein CNECB9_4370029 [Cupriavidus necator]
MQKAITLRVPQAYQAAAELVAPLQAAASALVASCMAPGVVSELRLAREICALYEWLALLRLRHERPPFSIHTASVRGEAVAVSEVAECSLPFCSLLHFGELRLTGRSFISN